MNLPDKFNTCIVVVTFNPDSSFTSNLLQYLKIVNKILIVDNNSIVKIESFIPPVISESIEVIHSTTNKGIAWALNMGIKRAKSLSYEWVITFDQDSFPDRKILSFYSEVLKKESNVGLIGTSFSIKTAEIKSVSWKRSLTIITSGALHPMEIFDNVNFYNEKLFIDNVDFDFSLRVSLAGFNVLRINEPLIQHVLGSPIKKFGLTSSNHNLKRRYYYGKNNMFLTRTYFKQFPFWILKKNLFFIKSILVLFIVEDDVCNKLRSVINGMKDEIKGL